MGTGKYERCRLSLVKWVFGGKFYKCFVWPCKGGEVGGYICIHILRHCITPAHQLAIHVFSTFSHHGRWLKHIVGDLCN